MLKLFETLNWLFWEVDWVITRLARLVSFAPLITDCSTQLRPPFGLDQRGGLVKNESALIPVRTVAMRLDSNDRFRIRL